MGSSSFSISQFRFFLFLTISRFWLSSHGWALVTSFASAAIGFDSRPSDLRSTTVWASYSSSVQFLYHSFRPLMVYRFSFMSRMNTHWQLYRDAFLWCYTLIANVCCLIDVQSLESSEWLVFVQAHYIWCLCLYMGEIIFSIPVIIAASFKLGTSLCILFSAISTLIWVVLKETALHAVC